MKLDTKRLRIRTNVRAGGAPSPISLHPPPHPDVNPRGGGRVRPIASPRESHKRPHHFNERSHEMKLDTKRLRVSTNVRAGGPPVPINLHPPSKPT